MNSVQFQLSQKFSFPSKSSFPVRKARVDTVSATLTAMPTSTMYDLLGVNEEASLSEIKAAYRMQARRWHPDACLFPDDKQIFTQKFMMARQAYEVLSDPALRRNYDLGMFRKGAGDMNHGSCRFGDWVSQLEGLKSRSDRVVRDSSGRRMRRGHHYGGSN